MQMETEASVTGQNIHVPPVLGSKWPRLFYTPGIFCPRPGYTPGYGLASLCLSFRHKIFKDTVQVFVLFHTLMTSIYVVSYTVLHGDGGNHASPVISLREA